MTDEILFGPLGPALMADERRFDLDDVLLRPGCYLNPQTEIMVVVDSPRGNIFGGVVAAPAFAQIGAYAALALSIKPDLPLD